MRLPHFAFQLELGRFMATLGIIDDVDESDEDGFYGASEPIALDGDQEESGVPTEHDLPIGFHMPGSGMDEEDA